MIVRLMSRNPISAMSLVAMPRALTRGVVSWSSTMQLP